LIGGVLLGRVPELHVAVLGTLKHRAVACTLFSAFGPEPIRQRLAIGDGRNDIEMLEWAGRGVAMGQAPQEVKDAADHVTASVYEDGAAHEISRWF